MTNFSRSELNSVGKHIIQLYDTKLGLTIHNSVVGTTHNSVVRHKIWLYYTKFGRRTHNSVVEHKIQSYDT
jgi:hypothetical protein